jgi:hypothetical protein
LPQGPLASDLLAECFLLPIDLALRSRKGYVRYVDDVRLFGATEDEVRTALITLERHCRERGLIPQIGKFAIKRAASVEDAMGMLPSISDPQHTERGPEKFDKTKARRLVKSAIDGKPSRVTDKTRLRYVLYRAEPDGEVLRIVLRLIPHHPEHTDAFFAYLGQFDYRKTIERACLDLVEKSPYSYVRGEAWHILAKYCRVPKSNSATRIRRLTDKAIQIAKSQNSGILNEKWGACHFLCASEEITGLRVSRFLKHQPPLLQALLAPVLPSSAYIKGGAVESYLVRSLPEPGLAVCADLHMRNLNPLSYGITEANLPSQVVNTLRELGVLSGPGQSVDPMGDILHRRYRVPRGGRWRQLLGNEYVHALGLLKQAEAAFLSNPSWWLVCQNSFNHAVFLALQAHLRSIGDAGACTTVGKNGQLVDFGVMLDATGPFARSCPTIAGCFRDMNSRRNAIPMAHPYEKRTATQTRYLTKPERARFVARLDAAYTDLLTRAP